MGFSTVSSSDFATRFRNFFGIEKAKTKTTPKPGKVMPTKVMDLKLDIAVVSDGGGWSVPMAIRKIEDKTKVKAKLINYRSPSNVNQRCLTAEVNGVLKHIEDNKLHTKHVSRAAAFIELVRSGQVQAPICTEIMKEVQEKAKNLDCIFLPGGEDVPSAWYGVKESHPDYTDYYRSIVELTLIHEARERGIPLMGVCRGLQITHVYHGKKLEQNVPNQYGVQSFELLNKKQKGLLADVFREKVQGRVMHHQGVSVEEGLNGKGDLESLTKAGGLIKAAESKFGAASPIITTQFHPEFYNPGEQQYGDQSQCLTDNNKKFFEILHDSADTKKRKRMAITPDLLAEGRANLKSVDQPQR